MVEITGNTYPVREKLKALGGRPEKRGTVWVWLIPDDRAEEARELVAAAPKRSSAGTKARSHSYPSRKRTCATCGCRINYGVYCGKCEFSR